MLSVQLPAMSNATKADAVAQLQLCRSLVNVCSSKPKQVKKIYQIAYWHRAPVKGSGTLSNTLYTISLALLQHIAWRWNGIQLLVMLILLVIYIYCSLIKWKWLVVGVGWAVVGDMMGGMRKRLGTVWKKWWKCDRKGCNIHTDPLENNLVLMIQIFDKIKW